MDTYECDVVGGVEHAEEARQRLVRDFDDDVQDTVVTLSQRSKASSYLQLFSSVKYGTT